MRLPEEIATIARGTLAHALEGMDENARLVLALLHVERLTVAETAEALGLDATDVLRTAERARRLLAERVEDRAPVRGGNRHEGRAA